MHIYSNTKWINHMFLIFKSIQRWIVSTCGREEKYYKKALQTLYGQKDHWPIDLPGIKKYKFGENARWPKVRPRYNELLLDPVGTAGPAKVRHISRTKRTIQEETENKVNVFFKTWWEGEGVNLPQKVKKLNISFFSFFFLRFIDKITELFSKKFKFS